MYTFIDIGKKKRSVPILFLIALFAAACVSTPQKTENSLVTMVKMHDIDGIKARFDTGAINTINEEGCSLLHIAVQQNDAEMTAYLLTLGAQSEATDPSGRTPLVAAATDNAFKAARVLALHNARIFAAGPDGITAFELFYDKHQTAVILNEHTVLQKDTDGKTLLHYAAERLDHNLVNDLLTAAGDHVQILVREKDSAGRTALQIVYAQPEEKAAAVIAAALLRNGAEPLRGSFSAFEAATEQQNYTIRFAEGQTALHSAAAVGHTGFVRFLLEQGAPLEAKNAANATALHEAVRNGQVATAAVLLDAKAQPNAKAALDNTPLHFAVSAPQNLALVQLLLEKKADPSLRDEYGETPLHIAVRVGASPDVLIALVQAGSAVDERNKRGETPLMLAVQRDIKEQSETLIKLGADIHAEDTGGKTPFVETVRHHQSLLNVILTQKTSAQQDSKGRNALHLAVLLKTDAATAEYLIRQNTAVNASDKAGNSPLHYAVFNNRKAIGEILLANGADIFSTNKQGESPLKIALTKRDGRETWILTDKTATSTDGNGDTPLHYAALWGMDSAIPYIISKGGNVNAKNGKGETPLFAAVKMNNPQTVKALFAATGSTPIDSFVRDFMGNTVLHTAMSWNARDAAEAVLMQRGVDTAALLNAKNTAGKTVLHIAAQKGDIPFITVCLNYQADINIDDATGRTPLTEAVRYGKTSTVLLLLKKGASPARQDIQGRTVLHEAAGTAPPAVIIALREAGADPLIRDSYGVTPLSKVLRSGSAPLDAMLGTDTTLSNSDGQTPLHIAVQEKVDEETLRYLTAKKYPVNKRDKTGSTALLLAAKQGNVPLCTVLLTSGADPFSANNEEASPVSLALTHKQELLTLICAFTEAKTDAAGNGILHYAARYADTSAIQTLLAGLKEPKTELNRKNLAGETPSDIATNRHRSEIAALLNAGGHL